MSKTAKPIIHSRDHEHGGADPVRIVWEDVGASGGGVAALIIADEGTPLPARGTLDFVGAGVTATDDAGTNKTIVTIPGGAGGGGIDYGVDNEGSWLDIGTSGATPTGGFGTRFHSDTTGTGVDNHAVGIQVTGDGSVTEGLDVTASGGGSVIAIGAHSGAGYAIQATTSTGVALVISTGNNGIIINMSGGSSTVGLLISSSAGNILQVTGDGQVHMRNAPIIGPF